MMTLSNFDQFQKSGVRATYYRVPIALLEEFREANASYGRYYKVRYRGPRFTVPSAAKRGWLSMQSTCLKQDATHFSVYYY